MPPLPERLWLGLFLGSSLALAGVVCWLLWVFAGFQEQFLRFAFAKSGALPELTQLLLGNRVGLLFLALPWLLCAIRIVVRGTASIRVLIAFSSTLIMVMLATTILFGIALSLPWGPHRVMTLWRTMHLDPQSIAYVQAAAERGDAEAHYLLFQHYALTTRQPELVEYYLARAAQLGHPAALRDLSERQRGQTIPIPGRSAAEEAFTPELER